MVKKSNLLNLVLSRVEELMGKSGDLQWEMQEIQQSVQQAGFLAEHLELRTESLLQFMYDLQFCLEDVVGNLSLPSKEQIAQAESAPELVLSLLP